MERKGMMESKTAVSFDLKEAFWVLFDVGRRIAGIAFASYFLTCTLDDVSRH
jgi:hypothetical protein